MILQYGSYVHGEAEAIVTVSKQPLWTQVGTRRGYVERWDVSGVLHGSNADELRAAMDALEAAYSQDNLDLTLKDSNGNLRHSLYSSTSISGVKIMNFQYGDGNGAEFTTYRNYSFNAEAEYLTSGGYESYQETFEFTGGGESWVMIPTIIGEPVRQTVANQTPFFCQQSGSAVGVNTRPSAPQPAFPGYEHVNQRRVTYSSPQYQRNGNIMYPVSWSYSFESARPMIGVPRG